MILIRKQKYSKHYLSAWLAEDTKLQTNVYIETKLEKGEEMLASEITTRESARRESAGPVTTGD